MNSYKDACDLDLVITWFKDGEEKFLMIKQFKVNGQKIISIPQSKVKDLGNAILSMAESMEEL
jgi:predicted nucleotidyltransferase